LNSFVGIGNLTREPEIRYTNNNLKVAQITIAINRKEEVDYIDCVAFDKKADIIEQYLHKGNKVAVEGRVQTNMYEKDGKKIKTMNILINNIEFLNTNNKVVEEEGIKKEIENGEQEAIYTDELPF
jgi:single-strand DNA-binding protein